MTTYEETQKQLMKCRMCDKGISVKCDFTGCYKNKVI